MNEKHNMILDLLDSDCLRSQPYQAPEAYLEQELPQAVWKEICLQDPAAAAVRPVAAPRPAFRFLPYAAAVVLFLGLGLGLGYWAWHEPQEGSPMTALSVEVSEDSPYTLNPQEVVDYLAAYGVQYEHVMGGE